MREADKSIEKTIKTLESRFQLVSKKKIKAWKAFFIIMFVAGFAAALFWSAYQGWSLKSMAQSVFSSGTSGVSGDNFGITPSPSPAPQQPKLKNLIYFPAGTKADYVYSDLNSSLMKEVKDSPYDSFAIKLVELSGDSMPTFNSFSGNLAAVKKSGKFVWPLVFFNRIVGCCEAPACVQELKSQGKCGDKDALAACYDQKSPDTGYKCSDNGYYCKNVCQEAKSLSPYFKNIAEKGKYIDLWDKAGALSDFYKLLETALKLAKESGAPGVFIDHEIYYNYRMYRISTIARDNDKTAGEITSRLEEIGREMANRVNSIYPDAVLLFASADFSKMQSDGKMRSTNYLVEGVLKQAKEKKYPLKVVDGGEKSIWYLHSALNDTGSKDKYGDLAGLKQRMDEQENNMKSYLQKYPKNFVLGGTHGLYLNWEDTGGNWKDWLTDIFNKNKLQVKTASDLIPLLKNISERREYVWIFSGAPSSKGYNEFSYSNDSDYISQFRNILRPIFCGNGSCEANRGETTASCPADCASKPTDKIPPERFNGLPNGVLPAGTIQTELSLATNENAICKYANTANETYDSMANNFSTTGQTKHSQKLTGLANGKTYDYFIKCKDEKDNKNSNDYKISFSVASPTPVSNLLYKGFHSFSDCSKNGGQLLQDSSDYFCKFAKNACPLDWKNFKNWSTTAVKTCSNFSVIGWGSRQSCITASHNWANIAPETCSYSGKICSANVAAIGCY